MRSLLLSARVGMSALAPPLLGPSTLQADETPARIRVLLAADAVLTIDGAPTKATSGVRDFITPPLQPGKDFHYDLRARLGRTGTEVTIERRITVRAGQETVVNMNLASEGASENRAFYYSPQTPAGVLALPPVREGVGGARDNWKPDFSDPFLLANNW